MGVPRTCSKASRGAETCVREDSGFALVTVVMMSAILFLLATSVLALVAFQASQVSWEVRRTKAMHVADAGITAYLYELRRKDNYYETTPTLAGTLPNGDRWSVTATGTVSGNQRFVTIRSTGTLASTGATRTVLATVGFPPLTQQKYTWLAFGNSTVYPGTTIYGNIIVQKPSPSTAAILNLYGRVTGFARCYGNAPGPSGVINTSYGGYTGVAEGGLQPFFQASTDPQLDVDSTFTETKASLLATATAQGTYFPRPGQATPGKGYWLELRGSYAVVWAVGGTVQTGTEGAPPGLANFPQMKSIRPDGTFLPYPQEYRWDLASWDKPVFYFAADVWVSGTYSKSLTVCGTGERIWLYHNILPSPLNGTATLGLVSDRDVGVPWYKSTPNDLTVYAAIFAKSRAIFKGDSLGTVGTKRSFTFYGSMTSGAALAGSNSLQQYAGSPWKFSSGYERMDIWFDNRLPNNIPPGFPLLTTGSTSRSVITVDSWVEN